ncbi:twin-arginine translocase subunit TatC [Schumannella sp. 10F1B-5-1]|uniref:twin-arginine translocase subunit TatC n=1 Tax=Schumannella sp. 10F1B-5-1 TaxID=2590780 RepID=UPI001131A123|nr:twin-arginine translocase subunit TatC [Schumannella sp. 10F1B-5-1]TPW70919.1 twin-arginine translocase subunit TatC [Schumannella sp. 10F1B-5-1]
MSLGGHLVELRNRLMIGALGVVAGTVAGFFLYDFVWPILSNPVTVLSEAKQGAVSINFSGIATAFDVRFQIALAIGIVISSPVWLWQIFAFLTPGLTRTEKRYVFGFFFSAVPLFLAGCAAGFFVMPHIVELMASFVPANGTTFFDAKYFLDFILKLVLATGVAFVLPVFLVLLNFAGVLRGRSILKGWRWAILAITLFTAAATPAADIFSMFLLAVPMVALYFAAVGLSMWHDRAVDRRAAAALASSGLPAEA